MVVDPVWTPETSLGAWLAPRLSGWGQVTAVVPGGYQAYARVLHLVDHEDCDERTTWAAVCRATGRTAHPLMQCEAISGTRRTARTTTMDWHGEVPEVGFLESTVLAAVLDVLDGWTAPDQECVMALWGVFGWVDGRGAALLGDPAPLPPAFPAQVLDAPRLELPGREYLLFAGPLRAAGYLGQRTPASVRGRWPLPCLWRQSPNLLWPRDRSWCLATDVDVDSTLVGGPASLVDALVAGGAVLEAYRVPRDGDLTVGGDHVKAPPTPGPLTIDPLDPPRTITTEGVPADGILYGRAVDGAGCFEASRASPRCGISNSTGVANAHLRHRLGPSHQPRWCRAETPPEADRDAR